MHRAWFGRLASPQHRFGTGYLGWHRRPGAHRNRRCHPDGDAIARTKSVVERCRLDDALLREAGHVAAAEASVVAGQHGSAGYMRVLVPVYVRRALHKAWGGAG
jgi:hypothetical protein